MSYSISKNSKMYSEKVKLDRHNSIIGAVKRELKAHNAFVPPEALYALADALDVATFYDIRIVRDPETAARALVLESMRSEHDGCEETARVVFGDATFGKDDWSPGAPAYCAYSYEVDADFRIDEPFIVLKHRTDETYGQYDTDVSVTHTIVVYTPRIIDKAYSAQKAEELTTLCTLREEGGTGRW